MDGEGKGEGDGEAEGAGEREGEGCGRHLSQHLLVLLWDQKEEEEEEKKEYVAILSSPSSSSCSSVTFWPFRLCMPRDTLCLRILRLAWFDSGYMHCVSSHIFHEGGLGSPY